MLRLVAALILSLAFARSATAQIVEPAEPPPSDPLAPPEDPDRILGVDATASGIIRTGLLAPFGVVEGDGVKIGEGTSVYPQVGMDTGFISNVFYEDTDTAAAGIIRLHAGIGTGSLSQSRLTPRGGVYNPGSVRHRAELRLSYDFYLSGNNQVTDQGGLGIAANARGIFGPQRTWSFLYFDSFERIVRAANFESPEQVTRDVNRLNLGVQFAPPGRSLRGLLRYSNTIDIFEDSQQRFANRMQNEIGLTAAWRFRPVTVLFADITQGVYWGIGDSSALANAKSDSYPFAVSAGIQTLLSLKTSLIGRIGYNVGFYSVGPSYNNVLGGLELGYVHSPVGRTTLMYEYRHQDSINANYYRDHRFKLSVDQGLVPFALSVSPELLLRQYAGIMTLIPGAPDTRDDLILAITAALRYNFRQSFAAVLQYRFLTVQTDYMLNIGGQPDDPSYARHELIAGVRAAL